jgi:hypothetical protein
LYEFGRLSGQDAASYFHLMIQTRVVRHLKNRTHGTRLRVIGSVHQPTNARVNHRSRTHRARFNCSKHVAVAETVIPQVLSGLAQRHNFSMSGWIVIGEVAIPSSADYAPFADDNGSDGNFSELEGALCAAEGFVHPKLILRRPLVA